jgi:hypothetical protein
LRPLPSPTDVRNRTPAADEELRCMSNHLVNKALLRLIEPAVALLDACKGLNPYAESAQPSSSWPLLSGRIFLCSLSEFAPFGQQGISTPASLAHLLVSDVCKPGRNRMFPRISMATLARTRAGSMEHNY